MAWWESGPAKRASAKQSKLAALNKVVREEYLPWIKHVPPQTPLASHAHRQTDTQTQTQTQTVADTDTDTDIYRHRHRHRHIDTDTRTQTNSFTLSPSPSLSLRYVNRYMKLQSIESNLIRHLFSTVDGDQTGSLNKADFDNNFYPTLQEYWELNNDHSLPPAGQCMAEMDDASLAQGRSMQRSEYVVVDSRCSWLLLLLLLLFIFGVSLSMPFFFFFFYYFYYTCPPSYSLLDTLAYFFFFFSFLFLSFSSFFKKYDVI